jgi:hypothetical protein
MIVARYHGVRRVFLAGTAALVGIFSPVAFGQKDESGNRPVEELRASVQRLSRCHTLTELQSLRLRQVLDELTRQASLFSSYGLLSPAGLADKIRDLAEVARNDVAGALDAEQMAALKHWEGATPVPTESFQGRPIGRKRSSGP